jgi:hypothetical protein
MRTCFRFEVVHGRVLVSLDHCRRRRRRPRWRRRRCRRRRCRRCFEIFQKSFPGGSLLVLITVVVGVGGGGGGVSIVVVGVVVGVGAGGNSLEVVHEWEEDEARTAKKNSVFLYILSAVESHSI